MNFVLRVAVSLSIALLTFQSSSDAELSASVLDSSELSSPLPVWVINCPSSFLNNVSSTYSTADMKDVRNDSKLMDRFVRLSNYHLPRVDGFTDGEVVDAIEHYFWGKMNGLAVELGALDGSQNSKSMTCEYERSLKWRRILVEGNPTYRQNLIKLSPKAFSVSAAICQQQGTVHFAPAEFTGGVAEFMSAKFMKEYHPDIYRSGSPAGNLSSVDWALFPLVKEVDCIPLQTVFHSARASHINFFILDVEGGEFEVLRSIDWEQVKFDVLCIETDPPNRPKHYARAISKYLSRFGYIDHSGQIGRNTWYTRIDFIPSSRPGLNTSCWNGFRKSDNAEKWWADRRTPAFQRCPMAV